MRLPFDFFFLAILSSSLSLFFCACKTCFVIRRMLISFAVFANSVSKSTAPWASPRNAGPGASCKYKLWRTTRWYRCQGYNLLFSSQVRSLECESWSAPLVCAFRAASHGHFDWARRILRPYDFGHRRSGTRKRLQENQILQATPATITGYPLPFTERKRKK